MLRGHIQISLSACGCIFFTLHPRFVKPAFRTYRAMMYASLGLFGLVFILHGLYIYEFALQRRRFALEWVALMAALNLIGAVVYAMRVSIPRALSRS